MGTADRMKQQVAISNTQWKYWLVKSCDSSWTMFWIKADMGMCPRSNMILRNTFLSGLFPVSDLQGLLDAVTIQEQVCDATWAPAFMKKWIRTGIFFSSLMGSHSFFTGKQIIFWYVVFLQPTLRLTKMKTEQRLWWSYDPGPCGQANWKHN